MLIKHRNNKPSVDDTAYVAPTAVLVGKVKVGPRSRIMFGAVINSEGSEVKIGECSIICENSVVRATDTGSEEHPVSIGAHVFIGPQSTVLGCTVEPGSYLATGVTVLQGAKIKSGAVVAVGALVHANTVIPNDFFVPPHAVAIGDPVQVFSHDEKEAMSRAIVSLGFARIAFNIDAAGKSRSDIYKEATEIRSKEFAHHDGDEIVS